MENAHEKIEAYLLGELSEPERADFESAMQIDADLAGETARHRMLLGRLEGMRMRQSVQQALGESPRSAVTVLQKWWWWLFAAGAIVALLFLLVPAPLPPVAPAAPPQPVVTPQLPLPPSVQPEPPAHPAAPRKWAALARQLQVQPTAVTVRNEHVETGDLDQVAAAYQQGDYRSVLRMLKQLHDDEDSRYYRANALFRLENYADAAAGFQSLESSFQYGQEARWNRFLCLLASGKTSPEQAQKTAAQMAKDSRFEWREKAKELAARLSER